LLNYLIWKLSSHTVFGSEFTSRYWHYLLDKSILGLPLIHTYRIVRRNSKYQPFLQMSELPVRRCGTVGSNTALKTSARTN